VSAKVPKRVAWTVDLLDVQPDDVILEFGCGPGVAANVVAGRLVGGRGRLLAVDRSRVAVDRTRARNAGHIDAGRMVVDRLALADLDVGRHLFDKAFGIKVNVFWTSTPDPELAVLARMMRPAGTLYLAYEGTHDGSAREVAPGIAGSLERHGFAPEVVRNEGGRMVCVIGRWAGSRRSPG
jgi:SAM-dependent methyltransferase